MGILTLFVSASYVYKNAYETKCFLWFLRVTKHLSNNKQLSVCGLCDHSCNLCSLTLVYVHTDGAKCLLIVPQEVSPC